MTLEGAAVAGLDVSKVNQLSASEAFERFHHCCGAKRFATAMVETRPYRDGEALRARVVRALDELAEADWREAFTHHPKIGDLASLRRKFQSTAHLAAGEQAGVAGAGEATLEALAAGNAAYERRFGYIFIVCATGKSAAEMLAILNARLPHAPEAELAVAAGEQRKITWLRLEKCFA